VAIKPNTVVNRFSWFVMFYRGICKLCETWFITFREEHKFQAVENIMAQKRIFNPNKSVSNLGYEATSVVK
jgi:hypothetical protein